MPPGRPGGIFVWLDGNAFAHGNRPSEARGNSGCGEQKPHAEAQAEFKKRLALEASPKVAKAEVVRRLLPASEG